MADYLSAAQANTVDRDNRMMSVAGIPMSGMINDLFALIDAGNIGITALAGDVDSLALGGGLFGQDPDTTIGLTFGYKAGRFVAAGSVVSVSAGTIALSGGATNYIEVDSAGTVSKNTTAFTAGRLRLYTVVCGAASITTVTNAKVLAGVIPAGSVTGSLLSAAAATKEVAISLGTISATGSFCVVCPDAAATISKVQFAAKETLAASDTNYFDFGLVNKGPTGTGTTAVVDRTAAANSTKATGGAPVNAYVRRNLTLSGTPADLNTAAGDVLELTITKTASPANFTQGVLLVHSAFAG